MAAAAICQDPLSCDPSTMEEPEPELPAIMDVADPQCQLQDGDTALPGKYIVMILIAAMVMVVGTLGNTLTLASTMYVRKWKPRDQFSILHLPVTSLLMNLSVCDLIYCAFGLPHMIHGMALQGDPYTDWAHFCLVQGAVRNLAVVADFNTMGLISAYVCVHHICRDGGSQERHGFMKALQSIVLRIIKAFKAFKPYLALLWIWGLALLAVLPDVVNTVLGHHWDSRLPQLGEFKWTNGIYGCDAQYTEDTVRSLVPVRILSAANLLVMLVSYALVLRQFRRDRRANTPPTSEFQVVVGVLLFKTSIYLIVAAVRLIGSICISAPLQNSTASKFGAGLVCVSLTDVFTCLYWCMYALNFVLYLLTSHRMRAAYSTFLHDLWAVLTCRGNLLAALGLSTRSGALWTSITSRQATDRVRCPSGPCQDNWASMSLSAEYRPADCSKGTVVFVEPDGRLAKEEDAPQDTGQVEGGPMRNAERGVSSQDPRRNAETNL